MYMYMYMYSVVILNHRTGTSIIKVTDDVTFILHRVLVGLVCGKALHMHRLCDLLNSTPQHVHVALIQCMTDDG